MFIKSKRSILIFCIALILLTGSLVIAVSVLPMEVAGINRPLYKWVDDLWKSIWDDHLFAQQLRSHSILIPFELLPGSNCPLVQVRLDKTPEVPFLLDTGCDSLLIDPSLIKHHPIIRTQINFKSSLGGSPVCEATNLDTISFGEVVLHRKVAFIYSIDRHLWPFCGILGSTALRDKCFTVDYKKKRLIFRNSDQISTQEQFVPFVDEGSLDSFWERVVPSLNAPTPLVRAELDGHEMVFLVDTGTMYNYISKISYEHLAGKDGKGFKFLKIGTETFQNPTFQIAPYLPRGMGILGSTFLKNFRTTFDYTNRRIFFQKN